MADLCKLRVGGLVFELDVTDDRALFEKIAHLQEVFNNQTCGKCSSEKVVFRVREVEDDKYYEMHCNECRARFSMGCKKKDNELFPKRKDAEGNYLPDNGWTRWDKAQQKEV